MCSIQTIGKNDKVKILRMRSHHGTVEKCLEALPVHKNLLVVSVGTLCLGAWCEKGP